VAPPAYAGTMRLERTVRTDKPIDRVFGYLADFTNTNDWDPGTVDTVRTSGDGGVGTQYANTSKFAGRETKLTYTVVERVEQEKIALEGRNKTVNALDTMTFTATPAGTEVRYTADFDFGLLTPVLSVVMWPFFKKLGDEAEKGMSEALSRL
jgi:carbon monoxide dehydrogenase subunit G